MNRFFRVVMVVERMEESVALLEKALPVYFRGATEVNQRNRIRALERVCSRLLHFDILCRSITPVQTVCTVM